MIKLISETQLATITTRKLSLQLRVYLAVYIISVLFDLMHWPFYTELTVVSVVGLMLSYSFRFYNKENKDFIDHIKLFFVITWSLNTINGVLYLIKLPPFLSLLPYGILIWLLTTRKITYVELFGALRLKKNENKLYTVVFLIAVISIFLGVLFILMHWPYASIMLIIGLLLFSMIVILDYFVREYPIDQNEIDDIGKR